MTDASLGGVSRVPLAWHEAAAVLVPDLPPYDVLSAAATRGDGLRDVDARQIELDLHRSHVSSIDVDDGHLDRLRRLLRAWCVLRPEIGYSQAMNFVASVMLHQCEGDEPAAFALFAALMAVLPAPSAGGRGRPPCSSTAPRAPGWWLQGPRPVLRTPERRLSTLEARRGPRSPPPAAPKSRTLHVCPAGANLKEALQLLKQERAAGGSGRPTRPEDGAPSASLDRRKAQAAPAYAGAPPAHLGGLPWPQEAPRCCGCSPLAPARR